MEFKCITRYNVNQSTFHNCCHEKKEKKGLLSTYLYTVALFLISHSKEINSERFVNKIPHRDTRHYHSSRGCKVARGQSLRFEKNAFVFQCDFGYVFHLFLSSQALASSSFAVPWALIASYISFGNPAQEQIDFCTKNEW